MSKIQALFGKTLRTLCKWGIYALGLWLLLAVLLAGSQQAEFLAGLTNADAALLIPMRELTQWTIKAWVWLTGAVAIFLFLQFAIIALLASRNIGGRQPSVLRDALRDVYRSKGSASLQQWMWAGATLLASAMKFGAMFFAGFGAVWCLLTGIELLNDDDPWDSLPVTTTPFLMEFQKHNQQISAERLPHTNGEYALYDGKGQSARVDKRDLVRGVLSLEPCPSDLAAGQLGGIAPFPGSVCTGVVRVRKTDGADGDSMSWHFTMVDGDIKTLEAHAKRLSDAGVLGGSGSSHSGSTYSFSASARDDAWHVKVNAHRGARSYIVIRHTPAKPAGQ